MKYIKHKLKQKLHETFAIKNRIIDEGIMAALSGSEFKCYLFIYRKTIGWQKDSDVISNNQFSQHTGLSRQSIVTSIKNLEQLGLIHCVKSRRNMTQYQLDNNNLLSLTEATQQQGKKLAPQGVRNLLLHCKKVALREQIIYPTKDTLLKDNYTKKELLNIYYEKTLPLEQILIKQSGIDLTPTILTWLINKSELLTKEYLEQLQQEAIATNQAIDSVIKQKMISQRDSESVLQSNVDVEPKTS